MTVSMLPDSIQRYVRRFVARQRRLALLRSGGLAIAFAIAWVILACLLDRWLRLPGTVRTGFLVSGIVGFIAILIRPFRLVLRRRMDWLSAAAEIERCNPQFAEALRTVISQLLEAPAQRGSPEIVSALVLQVESQAQQARPRPRGTWRGIAYAWMTAGLLLGIVIALHATPAMGMPVLMERLLRPMAPLPPVTTTQISVFPGDYRLTRGATLAVRAKVTYPGQSSVEVFTSQGGGAWTRAAMVPVSEDEYIFTIPSVDRDLVYRVQAGDASSRIHRVTVDRPPAVVEWRFRYEYPEYASLPPFTTSSAEGVIEALSGTKVHIGLTASEPLKSAVLVSGKETIALQPSNEAQVFNAQVQVSGNRSYRVQMTSTAGLEPAGPLTLRVRAQPDREPAVLMVQPVEDLRMSGLDLLSVSYQALDDYGISKLSLKTQINGGTAREAEIHLTGNARRQEGVHVVDLAALNLKVGDVLVLSIIACDGANHTVSTPPRTVLISPRSVDSQTHQRLGELRQAAQFSQAMRQEIARAAEQFDRVQGTVRSEAELLSLRGRYAAALANSIDAASLLHHSLVRAVARAATAQQAVALAELTDATRTLAVEMERLAAVDAGGEQAQLIGESLRSFKERGSRLAEGIRVLWQGDQAAALLVEQRNLRETFAGKAASGPLQETFRRAEQEVHAGIEELGLSTKAGDLDAALRDRVVQAENAVASARRIDFQDLAEKWGQLILKGDVPPPLPQRLSSASMIEAVRPDGNLIAARDFQLAARAATRLSQQPARDLLKEDLRKLTTTLAEFALAMGALQRDHELAGGSSNLTLVEEAAHRAATAEARRKIAAWAEKPEEIAGLQGELSDLAMQAGVSAVQRRYDAAAVLDQRLRERLAQRGPEPSLKGIEKATERAKAIDAVSAEQGDVSRETTAASDEQVAAKLVQRQRAILLRIERMEGFSGQDARRNAMQTLQQAQEELATLPQRLAAVVQSGEALGEAQGRARQLARAAADATDEKRPMALRMSEQAVRAASEAADDLKASASGIAPTLAEGLAKKVRSIDDSAADVIEAELRAALLILQAAADAADVAAVQRAAGKVRTAVELCRRSLREAHSILLDQDPLVAARWFAEASAAALDARPPDFPRARSHQQQLSNALSRAWHEAVRDAARQRLALTPSFAPILRGQNTARRGTGPAGPLSQFPMLREWSYDGPPRGDSTLAPLREIEPAGYEDQIRAYFALIEKAQNQR